MPDYILYNGSAATVETVAPGAAKKVTLLAAALETALATEGVLAIKAGTDGTTILSNLLNLVKNAKVEGDSAPNSMT